MPSKTTSYPAPVGGLNSRDSLANMNGSDAVILDDWFPRQNSVEIRKGRVAWSTGYAAPVQSLFKYAPTSGAYKLFAASGTGFYDATTQGAVGAAVVTGLTNSQWQYTNIITPGGSYLWCVNGVDAGRIYDGATWAPVSITGVASTDIIHVNVFGNRLFLVEKSKLKVWYLAVQSISGAAVAFDLSTIFTRGGYLMAMGTWSVDAGAGLDDQAVFVSSEGEVAIYKGTDPATWVKTGLYYIGRPIGRRCFTRYAGDFLLMCEEGLYPLSRALQSATIDRAVAITAKIQNDLSQAVSSYGTNYGWNVTLFPDQNQLYINVPTSTTMSVQYVLNTLSGAWCRFTTQNAKCWEIAGQGLYYGGQTAVYKAWTGQLDEGSPIQADALVAYQHFGRPAQNKFFTMVRPAIIADGLPSILFGLNLDFLNTPASGVLSYQAPSGMVWGSMIWGSMVWGGGYQQISGWQTVGGIGRYAAIRLSIQSNGSSVEWNATDYVFNPGGVL